MLQLSATILNRQILSLRTGQVVATSTAAIINPNNLKIEGFYCQDTADRRKRLILLEQDIREIISEGMVINDYDVLSEEADLIRLKDVLRIGFNPIGKTTMTVSKERLGKVTDYAVDIPSFIIKKLYVSQPLLRSLNGGQLSVDRTQIVEISDKNIVIQDIVQLNPAGVPAGLPVS